MKRNNEILKKLYKDYNTKGVVKKAVIIQWAINYRKSEREIWRWLKEARCLTCKVSVESY